MIDSPVFFSGIGFLLLLDLSANGYIGNRYLALYHHGHLWLGMLIFSVLVFMRQSLARALAWILSICETLAAAIRRQGGAWQGTLVCDQYAGYDRALDKRVYPQRIAAHCLAHARRKFDELVSYLFRSQTFPDGAILLTGTGVVPGDDFTLAAGDLIRMEISGIGTLEN